MIDSMPVYEMKGERVGGTYYTAFVYKSPGKPDRFFTERLIPEMREKADSGDVEAIFYIGLI